MRKTKGLNRRGFSLIELVIVVVIIGIIAAIAIPKLSRGSAGAADSALAADMLIWRQALEMYAAEHGGAYPALNTITAQLTGYTNADGNSGGYSALGGFSYGPYMQAIPPVPVGNEKGATGIGSTAGTGIGWIYSSDGRTYSIEPSATGTDSQGAPYTSY